MTFLETHKVRDRYILSAWVAYQYNLALLCDEHNNYRPKPHKMTEKWNTWKQETSYRRRSPYIYICLSLICFFFSLSLLMSVISCLSLLYISETSLYNLLILHRSFLCWGSLVWLSIKVHHTDRQKETKNVPLGWPGLCLLWRSKV